MLHLPFAAPGKHCCSPKLRPCWPAHLPRCPVPPHPSPRSGYVLGPVLGKGGFCSVRKALHELTGQAVACKIIEKGKLKVGGGEMGAWGEGEGGGCACKLLHTATQARGPAAMLPSSPACCWAPNGLPPPLPPSSPPLLLVLTGPQGPRPRGPRVPRHAQPVQPLRRDQAV